uniref:Uncharacterized protein n=1 Tax=Rhizophora mucronata TaxID=61149 RepID=A0A2P2LIM3_RHIMU
MVKRSVCGTRHTVCILEYEWLVPINRNTNTRWYKKAKIYNYRCLSLRNRYFY